MAIPPASIPTIICARFAPALSAYNPPPQKPEMVSRHTGLIVLVLVTILLFSSIAFIPRIPQPLSYHNFADQRPGLGIPNFGNVISNLPFAIFGLMGLLFLRSS